MLRVSSGMGVVTVAGRSGGSLGRRGSSASHGSLHIALLFDDYSYNV